MCQCARWANTKHHAYCESLFQLFACIEYTLFVANNLSWTADWFDWNTSYHYCHNIYGTSLASFHSQSDIESFLTLIFSNANFVNRDCWIGLRDNIGNNIDYTWTDGTPFDYTFWAPGTPNNAGQQCVRSTRYSAGLNATWDDFYCDGGLSTLGNSVATCFVCKAKYTQNPTEQPTSNPTFIPSINPSINPSIIPTGHPSFDPSHHPTFNPTYSPTFNPSIVPTQSPTSHPTFNPTDIPTHTPTAIPTHNPSIIPSIHPTAAPIAPTDIPSVNPTVHPSLNPTVNPIEIKLKDLLNLRAQFSDNFWQIVIDFSLQNSTLLLDYNLELKVFSLKYDCNEIFSNETNDILSQYSKCEWLNKNKTILITLSGYSTIMLDDIVVLNYDSFFYSINHRIFHFNPNATKLVIENILVASNPIPPVIVTPTIPTKIGICDDLVLDARNSYNLGRDASFIWCVANVAGVAGNNSCFSGKYVVIQNTLLSDYGLQLSDVVGIELNVNTWYNQTTSASFNISLSENIVPFLWIDGPNRYSNDGYDSTYSQIFYAGYTFFSNSSCLGMNIDFNVTLKWSIIESTNTINTTKINNYLSSLNENIDSVTFSIEDYLAVGYEYEISVHFDCNVTGFQCESVTSTHLFFYDFSNIVCQIVGGSERYLSNVSLSTLSDFTVLLDGHTFTYDPDYSDLIYSWQCLQTLTVLEWNKSNYTQTSNCTGQLITNSNTNPKQRSFLSINVSDIDESLQVLSTSNDSDSSINLVYQVILSVSDEINHQRDSCITESYIILENIDISNKNNQSQITKLLDVSLTATHRTINKNQRLRLLVGINNLDYSNSVDEYNYNYNCEWSELNQHLATEEIAMLRVSTQDSSEMNHNCNLILESNSLESGRMYIFSVAVSSMDKSYSGTSNVEIYVNGENEAPTIIDGSFDVSPNCSDITIPNVDQLFSLPFSLSVDAYSDNLPLYYQFSYQKPNETEAYLLHPSLLTDSFLDGMCLCLFSVCRACA